MSIRKSSIGQSQLFCEFSQSCMSLWCRINPCNYATSNSYSMTEGNLNKTEKIKTKSTTPWKLIITLGTISNKNLNSILTKIYLIKVHTSKCEHCEARFTFMMWWFWSGLFQFCSCCLCPDSSASLTVHFISCKAQ